MLLTLTEYLKNNKTVAIIGIVCFALILGVGLGIVGYFFNKKTRGNRKEVIRRLVTISIFSALSIVFYKTLKFPLPFAPSFLEVNFSNLPIIIASFMLGPVEGVIIALIRTIVTVPMTSTFVVGEVADLILSSTIALVSGFIYKYHRNIKGAIVALVVTIVAWIGVAIFANYFILAPAYIALFFGGNVDAFVGMISSAIPSATADNYMMKYIVAGVIPFNAIVSTGICLITFIVYKRISILFHHFDKVVDNKEEDNKENETKDDKSLAEEK